MLLLSQSWFLLALGAQRLSVVSLASETESAEVEKNNEKILNFRYKLPNQLSANYPQNSGATVARKFLK
jgi:hypothetical protein